MEAAWLEQLRASGDIPCLDTRQRLQPASQLLVNDADFLPVAVIHEHKPKFIHGKVKADWARALGVPSLRQLVLSDEKAVVVSAGMRADVDVLFVRNRCFLHFASSESMREQAWRSQAT